MESPGLLLASLLLSIGLHNAPQPVTPLNMVFPSRGFGFFSNSTTKCLVSMVWVLDGFCSGRKGLGLATTIHSHDLCSGHVHIRRSVACKNSTNTWVWVKTAVPKLFKKTKLKGGCKLIPKRNVPIRPVMTYNHQFLPLKTHRSSPAVPPSKAHPIVVASCHLSSQAFVWEVNINAQSKAKRTSYLQLIQTINANKSFITSH